MSTLGKVLLFVNVLLAAGVLFLATQDHAKRQSLNAALVKNSLGLNGMPVESGKSDSTDTVTVGIYGLDGQYAEEAVEKKLIDAIFSGVNAAGFDRSSAPASQIEEVQAVSTKLTQDIDNLKATADKTVATLQVAKLCGEFRQSAGGATFFPGLLMDLSNTFEERQAIRNMALQPADQHAEVAKEAKARLKRHFDAVLEAPNPEAPEAARKKIEELRTKILAAPQDKALKQQFSALAAAGPSGPCANDQERRLRIAQLLMQLSPSKAWQQRVATVVGLKTYQAAVTEQAGRLDLMAQQTRDLRYSDQASFDQEYEQLASFALEQSKLNSQQNRLVKGWQAQLATDTEIKNNRVAQVAYLKKTIAETTTEINAKLKTQAESEKQLFEVQREVGLTLRENGRLEEELRKQETQR